MKLHLSSFRNISEVNSSKHQSLYFQVSAYTGSGELHAAVEGADVVVIPAGVPRKPGMTRDDLFNTNAGIVRDLVAAIAKASPKVHVNYIKLISLSRSWTVLYNS